ncbi:MAG: hypothetical protein ACP5P1_07905 [Acidimicrobiales bacterium]
MNFARLLDVVGLIAGLGIVAATLLSTLRAVVLPRASQGLIPEVTITSLRSLFRARIRRHEDYVRRDHLMAMFAPVALLAMLVSWLLVTAVAYSLIFFCVTGRSLPASVELSGSSIVTLGTVSDSHFWPSLLGDSEAGVGLLIVALVISYLPSMYSAFTRRETGVTLLEVRAGNPPSATTMILRFRRIESGLAEITDLWRQWEQWFADIEESHTTFPILVFFRSPHGERSWVTAAGALLDGAALWISAVEHPADPNAHLCIRAGFLSLRRIADAFGIPYDPDPAPDGPVSVSRQEWDEAISEMRDGGVAVVEDLDLAWEKWRGWRVNYDTVLLRLARLIEAPPAPWVSDRSPMGGYRDRWASRRTARRASGRRR